MISDLSILFLYFVFGLLVVANSKVYYNFTHTNQYQNICTVEEIKDRNDINGG